MRASSSSGRTAGRPRSRGRGSRLASRDRRCDIDCVPATLVAGRLQGAPCRIRRIRWTRSRAISARIPSFGSARECGASSSTWARSCRQAVRADAECTEQRNPSLPPSAVTIPERAWLDNLAPDSRRSPRQAARRRSHRKPDQNGSTRYSPIVSNEEWFAARRAWDERVPTVLVCNFDAFRTGDSRRASRSSCRGRVD